MMQILLTVDKKAVSDEKTKLYGYLSIANKVSEKSTYAYIKEAEKSLNKAYGIYEALKSLGLLDTADADQWDLKRIENKIAEVLQQKRLRDAIRRY